MNTVANLIPGLLGVLIASVPLAAGSETYLDAAREAARWLRSTGRDADRGRVWPVDPEEPEKIVTDLYSGTAGVVLFFLEAHRLTGQAAFLEEARGGADYLLATMPERLTGEDTGLYTGVAGVGFTLEEAFGATGEEKYRKGALRSIELLRESARRQGAGVAWNETTDIISGSAGIGLFLLYAAREMNNPSAKELATLAGRNLLERGIEVGDGLKWPMSSSYPRLMPNFSHGTAGCRLLPFLPFRGNEGGSFS